jgi:hypothetical protein
VCSTAFFEHYFGKIKKRVPLSTLGTAPNTINNFSKQKTGARGDMNANSQEFSDILGKTPVG